MNMQWWLLHLRFFQGRDFEGRKFRAWYLYIPHLGTLGHKPDKQEVTYPVKSDVQSNLCCRPLPKSRRNWITRQRKYDSWTSSMTSAMMAVKQVMMVTVTMCHYPYRTLPVRLPNVPMSKENCIIPSEYWSVGFLWQARGGHAHTAYTALGNIYPVYSAHILLQAIYIQYILRIYCSRQYIPSIYCVYTAPGNIYPVYTAYIYIYIYCSRQYISNISWIYYILEKIVFSAFSC